MNRINNNNNKFKNVYIIIFIYKYLIIIFYTLISNVRKYGKTNLIWKILIIINII